MLTLTATPIPRTLNMALGGLRDMSLMTTPPAERARDQDLRQPNGATASCARPACARFARGGQVYFVHNSVDDIERVRQAAPAGARGDIRVGHGQMRERELERLMLDFYHRRFQRARLHDDHREPASTCRPRTRSSINRADRFGLAQLHQLRGRVGRSHHRA